MKISVISINRERVPDPLLPIAPALVAGCLREGGHDVSILDLCHEEDTNAAIARDMEERQPDLVAISLRQVENNMMVGHRSYLHDAKRVVEQVKGHSSCPILLGGAGFSLFPAEVLRYLDVPYGFAGEAERSVNDLVRCIEAGEQPSDIPGACYWADGEVVVNGTVRLRDFGWLPDPAYDLLDCPRYVGENAAIAIESKRGCDLACSFCPESADREGVRLKLVALVLDQIERSTKQVGTNRLFFTDSVFHRPEDHAMDLCKEIVRRGLDLRWTAGINPAGLSRELLESMKEAGCGGVGLGLDAATDGMLKSYHKGFSQEDIVRAFTDLRAVGLPYAIYLLFGGPGETSDTVRSSLDFLEDVAPDDPVFMGLGIRVFPGTPLERTAEHEGVIDTGQNMLPPVYYLSGSLDESLMEGLEEYCARHERWFTTASMWAALHPR
jgi:radical SAM superfamily enzyme YgiQ (UPF0313 family)